MLRLVSREEGEDGECPGVNERNPGERKRRREGKTKEQAKTARKEQAKAVHGKIVFNFVANALRGKGI